MDVANQIILVGGLLLLLAILAGLLSSRVGAPLLLVFLGLGMLAGEDGPGGIAFSDFQGAYTIASIALAVILFDGGLRTSLRTVKRAWASAGLLATVGVLITAAATGAAVHVAFGADWPIALLMGTVVASTDAAAVFLLLHQHGMGIRERVSATLELESGANDPMAIFLTTTLVSVVSTGIALEDAGSELATALGLAFGVGAAVGIGGGALLAWGVNRLLLAPGLYPVLVVAAALTLFGASQELGGSGFLTVYLAGIVAGNRRLRADKIIRRFHDGIAWVSQIVLLVMLGLLVTPGALVGDLLPGILVALALVFVARPLAVALCLLPSRMNRREKAFVAWVGLRGGVPIYMAIIPVLAGIPDGGRIFNVTFIVVLVSLALQGWSIPWVARRLGVEIPPPPEPLARLDVDLPANLDRDVLGYAITAASPVANRPVDDLALPPRARILAVLRKGRVVGQRLLRELRPGDFVLLLAPPEHTLTLDRRFIAKGRGGRRRVAMADFTFPAETAFGPVALAYEIPLTASQRDATLGDILRDRLEDPPSIGDAVAIGAVELVVMEIENDGIISVGLRLEPLRPDALPDLLPDWVKKLIRRWRKRREDNQDTGGIE